MPRKICLCPCAFSCGCKTVLPKALEKYYGKLPLDRKESSNDIDIIPHDPRVSRGVNYCRNKPILKRINFGKKRKLCTCLYLHKWKVKRIVTIDPCKLKINENVKFRGQIKVPKKFLSVYELRMLSKKPCP